MDEQQFQEIIGLLKKSKKTLRIIQYAVVFTLGFILTINIMKLFP